MKYAITSPLLDGCITLEYYKDTGMIAQATFDFELKPDQAKWLASHFPIHESMVDKVTSNGTITKYNDEPEFMDFYRRYDNKVGKIAAQRAWKKLKDFEKVLAIKNIPKYKSDLKGYQDMLMPATYLNNQRFMDYEKDPL